MQAHISIPAQSIETRPIATVLEVRGTHLTRVRGYEVELYGKSPIRSRGGVVRTVSRFIDVGEWRQGGYVRWVRDKVRDKFFDDYFLLDEIDELLRAHFPAGAGTVQRADQPISIPSVRLSSVRG